MIGIAPQTFPKAQQYLNNLLNFKVRNFNIHFDYDQN